MALRSVFCITIFFVVHFSRSPLALRFGLLALVCSMFSLRFSCCYLTLSLAFFDFFDIHVSKIADASLFVCFFFSFLLIVRALLTWRIAERWLQTSHAVSIAASLFLRSLSIPLFFFFEKMFVSGICFARLCFLAFRHFSQSSLYSLYA